MSASSAFIAWVARRPIPVIALVGVLTLFALAGIVDPHSGKARLQLAVSTEQLLPDGDEHAEYYASIRRRFGNDDTMLVVLASDDLFVPDRLARLAKLTRAIEAVPGVHRVFSLATATRVRGDEWGIDVSTPLDPLPVDEEAARALRAEVFAHPFWPGTVVSDDGSAAALVVSFDRELSERDMLERELPARVAELARQERGDSELWLTGPAYIKLELTQAVLHDLARIIPCVLALLVCVLGLCFRSVRCVLVPFATIAVAVTWTLGTMGWAGIPLSLVTTILPPLLLTVGFAYAIHVVAAGERKGDQGDVALAVLVTGVTTAIGFAALALSPIHAIREFGLLAALGTVYTVLLALTLAPAVVALLPSSVRPYRHRRDGGRTLERAAESVARFATEQRTPVLAGAACVLVASIVGLMNVETGMDPMASFAPDAEPRVHYRNVSERFGGVSPLSVVLEASERGAFAEPALLRQVDALAALLAQDPDVAQVVSVVDSLRLLHAAALGVPEAEATLPESRSTVRQLLLLAAGPEQRSVIDAQQKSVRLLLRARQQDSTAMVALIERIEMHLAALPVPLEGRVTGNFVQLSRAGDALARGQLHSLLAAVGVIFSVIVLMFRSVRIGLAAFLPNVLPIAAFFGVLAACGIPLNPTTGLIACMALGIAVDDTIHYFARFRADAWRLGSERQAATAALVHVIRPISCTTLGLCCGFAVMTTSDLQDHVQFGFLAAATLALAWVTVVLVTPALCSRLVVLSPWGRAAHALGGDPGTRVPLLNALPFREARRLLDSGEHQNLPADERLAAGGAPRLVLVLAGALTVRAGNSAPAKLGPGDAFVCRNEFDVTAEQDVQVLCIPERAVRRRASALVAQVDGRFAVVRDAYDQTST